MVASRRHPRPVAEETDQVRGIYDTMAPRYDQVIAIADRSYAMTVRGGRAPCKADHRGTDPSRWGIRLAGPHAQHSLKPQTRQFAARRYRVRARGYLP